MGVYITQKVDTHWQGFVEQSSGSFAWVWHRLIFFFFDTDDCIITCRNFTERIMFKQVAWGPIKKSLPYKV
jgi:hypothetical protein